MEKKARLAERSKKIYVNFPKWEKLSGRTSKVLS